MSNQRKQVLKNTSETLYTSFPSRPTVASGLCYDSSGSAITSLSSDPISLGVSLTVSGECGYSQNNRRTLSLNTTTGLEWNKTYLVTNTSSQQEYVKLLSIPTTRICELDEELRYDYTTGDALTDPSVGLALTPSETDNLGTNNRIRIEALFSDGSREWKDILFDVVLHKVEQPITSQNLRDYDATLSIQISSEQRGTDWSNLLEIAWQQVCEDIYSEDKEPSNVIDSNQLALLQLYKLRQLLSEQGIVLLKETSPLDAAKYFKAQYIESFTRIRSTIRWNDEAKDLAPSTDETRQRKIRIII